MFTGRLRSEIPHSVTALTEAILDQPLLASIDFSDNAFGPDGIKPLVPLLQKRTTLAEVRLNNTGLGPQGGQILAEALLESHQLSSAQGHESSLRILVAGRSRLENGSMPFMAKALQAHGQLREIHFPQNGIRPEGIVILMAGLSACPELEILDLQDNTFSVKGSRALAKALPHWPKLKRLNIGDCMLKSQGCLAIIEAFKNSRHPDLEYLNLQYNEINEEVTKALAGILKLFPKLKKIELNGNWFCEDSEAVDALREALDELGLDSDVLGSLSDMEEEDSEAEEEHDFEESDGETQDNEADELAEMLGKSLHVGQNGAK